MDVADLAHSNANDARARGAPLAAPFQVFFYGSPREKIPVIRD